MNSLWENCRYFTPSQVKSDAEANLFMLSSDIIMCGSDCYEQIAEILPPHAIVRNSRFEEAEVTKNRSDHYGTKGKYTGRHPMSSESLNHDWSHEITWRLNRAYELKAGIKSPCKSGNHKLILSYQNPKMSKSELKKFEYCTSFRFRMSSRWFRI